MVFLISDEKQCGNGKGVEIKRVGVNNGEQNLPRRYVLY